MSWGKRVFLKNMHHNDLNYRGRLLQHQGCVSHIIPGHPTYHSLIIREYMIMKTSLITYLFEEYF